MSAVIAMTRFAPPAESAFEADARALLGSLSVQAGFVRGRLAHSVDEPSSWALVTEWETVGSYRRGLSAYDVKVATAPLLAWSVLEPGAYDVVAAADDPQAQAVPPSARAR